MFALVALVLAFPCGAARPEAKPEAKAAKPAAKPAANPAELEALRGRIQKMQRDLAAAESTRSEAADQLRVSEKAVSEAHRALFALAQQAKVLQADLDAIAGRERQARADISEQEALAGRLLRLQYLQGAPDRLRIVLEGKDAAQVARHLAYLGYVQRARAGLIGELRKGTETLAELQVEALARRETIAANQAEQAREARKLETERATRAATVKRLAGEVAKGQREIGRLKRDEARLAKLVEELARALAAKSRESAKSKGRTVDQVPDASLAAKAFATLKGRLRLPVRGEIANRFGAPREEGGATWKGLFIRAGTGETVRAVADGRVVYADWLRGFGNLLILDHGGRYMSLYAYNEGLLRQLGDSVRSGDPISHVGQSGGSSGESGLYFELRHDGRAFDPLQWVAP
jgi:septal ring factor EnvC (AmiA/AmiB activator)